MIKAAREQSLMTHQDVRCAAGAVAIAGAVSLLLSQKTQPSCD
jgi:ADP-ribosylglycohydrolase